MENKTKKAVVLLSGGLDSATVLHIAKKQGYRVACLIFDYGQRHKKEIAAAKKIANAARVEYDIIKFRMPWKGSSLTDKNIPLPKYRMGNKKIPSTYVPFRNTLFLAFGVSAAEATGAETVFIGANSVDFSGYPDCRPEYFRAWSRLIKEGAKKKGIKVKTPLLNKNKSQIIKKGILLKVPYQLTWSCYRGGKKPCDTCDSCALRNKGFRGAGIADPLIR